MARALCHTESEGLAMGWMEWAITWLELRRLLPVSASGVMLLALPVAAWGKGGGIGRECRSG